MNRLFGRKKKEEEAPVSLEDTAKNMQDRVDTYDSRIRALDQQLLKQREAMKKLKPGSGGYETCKRRALQVMKQKKMYEQQRDRLMEQQFGLEQTKFTTQQIQDSVAQVRAMRAAHVELKKATQSSGLHIDEIDKLQDEMADIMDLTNEIQEALGRSYEAPDDMDEAELMGELEALEAEMGEVEASEETPSYLQEPDLPDLPASEQAEKAEATQARAAA